MSSPMDTTTLTVAVSLLVATLAQTITFDVQEERPAPFLFGNIFAKMNRAGNSSSTISQVSRSDLFRINKATGDISSIVVLDAEKLCPEVLVCFLTITLMDEGTTPITYPTVQVNILDINDRKPEFNVQNYVASFSEDVKINSTVMLPAATDADIDPANQVQSYRLDNNYPKVFDLVVEKTKNSDGTPKFMVSLRVIGQLDRETVASYSLSLVASDGPHEVKLPVQVNVIDANDNAPVFSSGRFERSIKETTPVGSTVLIVSASDADEGINGKVGYKFYQANANYKISELFGIDPSTGEIKTLRSLETEGGSTFTFKVRASDNGVTPSSLFTDAEVVITVEDTVNDPPKIKVVYLNQRGNAAAVSEDAALDTIIAAVQVTDSDSNENGMTSCSLSGEFFAFKQQQQNYYTVSVARALDRETNSNFVLPIVCVDRGSPPLSSTAQLSIVVDDVNDNPPVFSRAVYVMSVKENQEIGELVGSVTARDADTGANARLRYALDPGVVEFEINESNGYIYTAVRGLDRETTSKYTLQVLAFDESLSPLTATATVIIDIEDLNDNWPAFELPRYKFQVTEGTKPGAVVGQVTATDPDLGLGGKVEYILINSPLQPDPPFSLSIANGTLTLTSTLDYETSPKFHFVVTAFDLGKPPRNSSVEIEIEVLDENDNFPLITFPGPDNQSVVLNLDVAPGHEVVKVIAHDPDSGENGRLTYSLLTPNTTVSRLFWINQDTGLVTLVTRLTATDIQSFNIVISVHDNGNPQKETQANLRVDIVEQTTKTRSRDSYMTIVIIMVCVTLCVAVIVLATLCFIRFMDKRKFSREKHVDKQTFDKVASSTQVYITEGGGDDVLEKVLATSPLTYPTVFPEPRLGTQTRPGKKCVTFDSAVPCSDTSETSTSQPDTGFTGGFSTFNPAPPNSFNRTSSPAFNHSFPQPYNNFSSGQIPFVSPAPFYPSTTNSRTGSQFPQKPDSGFNIKVFEEEGPGDQLVDVALQKHNALVRSMRGGRRPPCPNKQVRPASTSHDTDLCSSSSVETSDSGRGGSELDVSVLKMNV
ncbi:protocadherin gamma-A11-like isoform X2 [Physella acuta]|uniref:protocadherin gamma-A11-like isoform X2 n=1 Tax=Physella acuta TaxID=109671 RepID=UPI0027DBE4C7|nr:protocadherin gamma-A11-like isoform X2 [Physella acuta]